MTRSTIIIVSDDVEIVQRGQQFGNLNSLDVITYSTKEWQQCSGEPGFLKDIVTVENSDQTLYRNTTGMGNVLPFPSPEEAHEGSGTRMMARSGSKARKISTINEIEAIAIENAIFEYNGNLTEAARALGIGRATLYRKVKLYQIDANEARKRRAA